MVKYFIDPFGIDGDRTAVPNDVDPSGYVNYKQGYTSDYALESDQLGYKPIERDKWNDIIYQITLALQYWQQNSAPAFITSADNDGTPYSYGEGVKVVKSGVIYTSLVGSNTQTPPDTQWSVVAPVKWGGTGLAAITAYNFLIGNGTSAPTLLAPSATVGMPLVSKGASANPAYDVASAQGGGTGRGGITANSLVAGNGNDPVNLIAPGTATNLLASNGTAWESVAATAVAATIGALLYPVGSYYINETSSTNPATLLGFGTWTAVTDKFIVARGSTYSGTGGLATATLTQANIPDYNLPVKMPNSSYSDQVSSNSFGVGGTSNSTIVTNTSGIVKSGGSGTPVAIIPPYQAAYIWKRTA